MSERHQRDIQMRTRLAQEAAKIMIDAGIRDFRMAKQKAASRLGAHDTKNMPSNSEIEAEIISYQRLFHSETQPEHLLRLRQTAIEAMKFFKEFNPLLVGPVLSGSADHHSPVTLHLFAATLEQVTNNLLDRKIPYTQSEKKLRIRENYYEHFPVCRFLADETTVELLIFPLKGKQHAPLSPIDGRPMQRADIHDVMTLVDETIYQPEIS